MEGWCRISTPSTCQTACSASTCKACGHRAALDKDKLRIRRGNMTELRDLKLRCEKCETRGTALKEFEFYIPHDFDEAKAFLMGEPLGNRRIDA